MKCPHCSKEIEPPLITVFLGWPIHMWFEIYGALRDRGLPDESPLATLSRLIERADME